MRPPVFSRRQLFLLGVCAFFIAAMAAGCLFLFASRTPHVASPSDLPDSIQSRDGLFLARELHKRTKPISIPPNVGGMLPLTREEYEDIRERIQLPTSRTLSVSQCLHVLRVHGLKGRLKGELDSCGAVLDILMNAESGKPYFAQSPMVLTRNGIRYSLIASDSQANESHRDQFLADLAFLGVRLSRPLVIAGRRFQLRDVLCDSVANFHLDQKEIAWTATAYALYMPPSRKWVNRFGEWYSFDDLAEELLERPLNTGSCGGAHLVFAMTALVRADQQQPVLSEPTRLRLWERLKSCVAVAIQTQRLDGSWPIDWNETLLPAGTRKGWTPVDEPSSRLLATSHLAEWMLYLPEELQAPSDVLERAGIWLQQRLAVVDEEGLRKQFCPRSHAACVVRQLAFVCDVREVAERPDGSCHAREVVR